jgi:TRAP-type C4-dicarboxylate transport system permease small subunit
MSEGAAVLNRMDRSSRLMEDVVLATLLSSMILLAGAQIFLRNVMDSGMVWADEFLRIQVLWIGLAGAIAASRSDNHIRIDILSKFLPLRLKLAVQVFLHGFTALICTVVAWHAGRFVLMEREFGATVLGTAPAWFFIVIIPIAFGLIAFRYLVNVLHLCRQITRGGET